jgi:hypothetical protein
VGRAGLGRRLEALEAAYAGAATGDDVRERLVDEFCRRTLGAMAHIRRAPIDEERWRYRVEKLRGEAPVTVLAHIAALRALSHEDEGEARKILAGMEQGRDLGRGRHEALLEAFAWIAEGAGRP